MAPTQSESDVNQGNVKLQGSVRGRYIRGGTSKGFYVRESELPSDPVLRDRLLLELYGTPDPIQIDGIGASESSTSKLMIVEPSNRDGIDLDYTFAQIAITKPTVGWDANCGNLTSAVGVYAILEGLVSASEPVEELRLFNTNTKTVIEQDVPIEMGEPAVEGEYTIDGVPGTGARIDSHYLNPAGDDSGSPYPTGNPMDRIEYDGKTYEISLVDLTNPCVFVRAADLGLSGTELPADFYEDPDMLRLLEGLRGVGCQLMDMVEDPEHAERESASIPFIAVVSEPQSYECSIDKTIDAADIDITSRIITTQTPHHAHALTGALCLAGASQLSGTIPNEMVRSVGEETRVTIGHPKGTITIGVSTDRSRSGQTVTRLTNGRTARQLMVGRAFYRYVDGLTELD